MNKKEKKKIFYLLKIIKYLSLAYFLFWVGRCSHIIYDMSKSALPTIIFPVPLKADGATYEFEYIPPKANLKRQTLFLYIDNNDYLLWREKLNIKNPDRSVGYTFIIQMKIYHNGEELFKNIYFYKDSFGVENNEVLGEKYNYQKIKVQDFYAYHTKYLNDFFEFKSGEKYKIVFKDLCVNPEISHLKIYLGLTGAGMDRIYHFEFGP